MTTYMQIPLIGKVKHPSGWIIGLAAVASVVIGSTSYLIVNRATPQLNLAELTVPVQSKNLTLRITASGKVVPVQSVNISPKTSGRLAELLVEQGDTVKKGQIIARMDDSDIQAQLTQSRANFAKAQAQLAQARAGNRIQEIERAIAQVDAAQAQANLTQQRVKRYRQLERQGAISQDQLDQYISEDRSARASLTEAQRQLSLLQSGTRQEEIAAAVASVAAAQGQLQAVQVQLKDTIIRAPFDGIVTQKYATVGAFVTPTTSASSTASATSASIVAIATTRLEVLAQVPEVDIGQIKQGQPVEIVADAYPDRVFKGRVRLIAPEAVVEQNVTSFQVRVDLETGLKELRSNMNADVTFIGSALPNAVVVPTVTIVTENGQTGVLVPGQNNQPQLRPVTIGPTVQNQTQILSGIKEGDRVFINPPNDYKPNESK